MAEANEVDLQREGNPEPDSACYFELMTQELTPTSVAPSWMASRESILQEAKEIQTTLESRVSRHWDGRQSILELKRANYQWKQMEWIGWYFEFEAEGALTARFGSHPGPKYGNTRFDFQLQYVWDFKTHPADASSWIIINDEEAVDSCLIEHGGLGVVIAVGATQYDDAQGSFKAWHDRLKGGISDYERERIRRAALSRKRKTAFDVSRLLFLWLTEGTIKTGLSQRWIGEFQKDMRNSDGSPRRAKYEINLDSVPTAAVILRQDWKSSSLST